ncbi:MAG: dTDP-4-dehydrorhamnose 3,5-epimerase family protein [Anaerolineae bacterium]|jgi:dTDP-4-dehydrorhamnose 3,5-epimerase|nr:dTDP-4-dehydrorhamnose 3,5-epimerase family protein [Anaerolineae bacterium]MDH7475618.1 dTDP-4-dehydrorhamnose 3,5-epimerase family protein [Anaerolineae bacterium]
MIEGVTVRKLRLIPDERGFLMEMLRSDWEEFDKFGQVYVTAVYPGVVKGWHYHKIQTDRFVCVAGMAKVVLYDGREGSPTRGEVNEFFMGIQNPILLKIPPGVMHGFKGISPDMTLIINIPSEPYNYENPDEYRLPAHTDQIPYDWARKDG